MFESRNNHYVPQWYQEGFFEPGAHELASLDLDPQRLELADGRAITLNCRYRRSTSGLFVERDLYSTFGIGEVNVEIERFLFGAIDTSGARAVRALIGTDVNEWVRHFQTLFEFLDIQKLRTPKGLDWLRGQYPITAQNELMREMQGLRMLHCSIWNEGVKEIVSAEDSEVKFITSDHPVTIYNRASPPGSPLCAYPNDPSIALNGSQTLFPLNRDFCLILTNLEYARDPSVDPLVKRTFARNFRQTMVRADAFIRERKLGAEQVSQINSVIMGRARKFLAAGRQTWLSPDPVSGAEWRAVADTLAPPKDALWQFGGEMFAKFKDGTTHFQDEFGRREPEHQAMLSVDRPKPKKGEACGCGSQRRYRDCCEPIPKPLRPSWTELSIRERNLALRRAVIDIFGVAPDRSWEDVRRGVTDEKIAKFYSIYASLWPIDTDLLSLLPKPDGRPRAVYTGILHPQAIADVALSAGLYFGELLIENPLPHARMVKPEFSPTENPQNYRGEVLKAIIFLLDIMPLVEVGLVNLIPNPCEFDSHLRQQMMVMARERNEGRNVTPKRSDPAFKLMKEDSRRNILLVTPPAAMVRVAKAVAKARGEEAPDPAKLLEGFEEIKRRDPLAVLQSEAMPVGRAGGQMTMTRLAPNFEIAMYLAQATGACIVTDSAYRWREILEALMRQGALPHAGLPEMAKAIEAAKLPFPQEPDDIARLAFEGAIGACPSVLGDATTYLHYLAARGRRPNFEAQLATRFVKAGLGQSEVVKAGIPSRLGRLSAVLPAHGIRDNTVNRLLLMSSSDRHWDSVPAAYFVQSASQ